MANYLAQFRLTDECIAARPRAPKAARMNPAGSGIEPSAGAVTVTVSKRLTVKSMEFRSGLASKNAELAGSMLMWYRPAVVPTKCSLAPPCCRPRRIKREELGTEK